MCSRKRGVSFRSGNWKSNGKNFGWDDRPTSSLCLSRTTSLDQQTMELQALITYLNSLTDLDQSLGVTLDRWSISVKREDENVKLPEDRKTEVNEKLTAK